eukprot:25866_1
MRWTNIICLVIGIIMRVDLRNIPIILDTNDDRVVRLRMSQGDRIGDALPNSNVDEDIAIELDPVDALPNSNDEMSLNNNNGIQTDRRGKKRRHRNDNIESQCGHRYNTRSRAKKRRTST